MPEHDDATGNANWRDKAIEVLRRQEAHLAIHGTGAPSAYVFITNDTSLYNLTSGNFQRAVLAEGFKVADFKLDAQFHTIREARESRARHADMFQLLSSIRDHYEIPSTFEGEIPEFAFGEASARLLIGQRYVVQDADGHDREGTLTDALVIEQNKSVFGAYLLDDGNSILASTPISDTELSAYRRHPESFFGVYRRPTRKTEDPLELYDFFYDSYQKSSKTRLLQFMKNHPDAEELKHLTQEELAILYCERLVYSVIAHSNRNPTEQEETSHSREPSCPTEEQAPRAVHSRAASGVRDNDAA